VGELPGIVGVLRAPELEEVQVLPAFRFNDVTGSSGVDGAQRLLLPIALDFGVTGDRVYSNAFLPKYW